MLVAVIPVIVLLLGIVLWAVASAPLLKDMGRIMFAVGLLVTVWGQAGHTLRLP